MEHHPYSREKYDETSRVLEKKKAEEAQLQERLKAVEEIKSPTGRNILKAGLYGWELLKALPQAATEATDEIIASPLGVLGYEVPEFDEALSIPALEKRLEHMKGDAHEQALALNVRYEELKKQIQEGIVALKKFDQMSENVEGIEDIAKGLAAVKELKELREELGLLSQEAGPNLHEQ